MFWRAAGSFARSERGAVAVYVMLALTAFFPLIAIAIDATSFYKLNTELKQAADAAALAAAVELDFTAQGLIDAENAARNAVKNFQTGANDGGGSDVEIALVHFMRALPPAGNENYPDYVTTEASKARYVRVVTEARQRDSLMYRLYAAFRFVAPNDTSTVDPAGAVQTTSEDAIAGKVTVACQSMPIFMCNPAEVTYNPACGNPNVTLGSPEPSYSSFAEFLADNPDWRRRQFRLKWIGPQTEIEPGVFGLLEPITGSFPGNGANAIAHELAIANPSSCVVIQDNELDVKTGQTQSIVNGLNTRFDIYRGTFGSVTNNPGYAPALNRTKGALPSSLGGQGGDCDPEEMTGTPPQVKKLPQDSCFTDNPSAACDSLGAPDPLDPQGNYAGRYGNAEWDAVEYFNVNHPRADGKLWDDPSIDPLTDTTLEEVLDFIHQQYGNDWGTPDATAVDDTLPPSRWAVYRWETAGSGAPFAENRIAGEPLPPNPIPGDPNGASYDDRIPGAHTRLNIITKEEGRSGESSSGGAMCSQSTPLGPYRRTLNVAVVNCCEQSEQLSSGQRRVKITEWAETFLTEPAQANNSGGNTGDMGAIYVEVYNVVKANDSDRVVLRDYVQLY